MATKKRMVTVENMEEQFTIETKQFNLCVDCLHRQNYLPGDSLCGYYRSPVNGNAYRKCKALRSNNPKCELFKPSNKKELK